jgi:hypothetical protein
MNDIVCLATLVERLCSKRKEDIIVGSEKCV